MKLLVPNHEPCRLRVKNFGAVFNADVDLETLCAAFDNMLDTASDVREAFASVLGCLTLGCILCQSYEAFVRGFVMLRGTDGVYSLSDAAFLVT